MAQSKYKPSETVADNSHISRRLLHVSTPLLMFPNKHIEKYYQLCEETLSFSGFSWWIIDLEDDPDTFYCNREMCKTFSLDPSIIQHSVRKNHPIARDYYNNISTKKSAQAQHFFDGYNQLKKGIIDEYCNRFPYSQSVIGEASYFSSRVRALLRDDAGKARLLVGMIEPELTSSELYGRATVDSLTKLKSRPEFDSQLSFLTNLAIREKHNISLVICDVDDFKQYNDLLGHYAGDECLVQIAQSISDVCKRSSDITCRYDKEKFAVITYGNAHDALFLAHTLRERICAMAIPHPAKNNAPMTVSVGYCSTIPDANCTPRKLIEWAETALYRAQNNGGNACAQFEVVEPKERFVPALFS